MVVTLMADQSIWKVLILMDDQDLLLEVSPLTPCSTHHLCNRSQDLKEFAHDFRILTENRVHRGNLNVQAIHLPQPRAETPWELRGYCVTKWSMEETPIGCRSAELETAAR